jgi:hypothetical protein
MRSGGRSLSGDFGVIRPFHFHFTTPVPQTVYLYETPGKPLAATFWFRGDDNPTEVAPVADTLKRFLVKPFALDKGDTVVEGEFMTDGGSYYPADFGLTTVKPDSVPLWTRCPLPDPGSWSSQ